MELYNLKNQLEKVIKGDNTVFLNLIDANYIINNLNKLSIKYKVFKPFADAEKIIIYRDKLNVSLLSIKTKESLTHREILGALFHHNIEEFTYGDIIISNKYYIIVLDSIKKYLLLNFNEIGKKKISLEDKNIEEIKDHKLKYKELIINCSSLRIDNIISKIIPTSRKKVDDLIKEQKIILNYQIIKNGNKVLIENDIFSIRGIGKFRFYCLNKINKSGKYNLIIKKYI